MKVAVIGDGGWGTALAMVLDRNGHETTVWGPFPEYLEEIKTTGENKTYLPGVKMPASLNWTSDHAEAVKDAGLVVLVVPSRFYKPVVEAFKPFIPASALIVSATKGLDEQTHERMSETAEEILGREVAVLSGPSHAEEVARGVPCAVAIAARDHSIAEQIQQLFLNDAFRVYTLEDVVGVELGGALKNVVAVAAGISDGLGFGDNSKAALMTRGIAEITRLGAALGAQTETFMGLSGIGDLMVTCMSRHSRNRGVGERLGKGETLDDIMGSMKMVAEGVWNCQAAAALAGKLGVSVPITEQVNAVVHEGKDPRQAMLDLMSRAPKPEQE
ncbi:NAD(P)H-dependent glycerol-3-phosphate dehydrogenase [Pontiella sulfatireligans]|uniref:Glycerol-3-phosphate dehydrogenase [NAD(P)+] n=1 Tax=Pontiella sulfatireligans TaxID=2750658 RepID=A0A6C2ULF3_9BACT|nr:NAD(P)H-dependent glycerol-3-phosphate dehydrogenase [Pontiella sulfatireligans]VGO20733.1 Glycerol-3-phosphate dehydrogenase [NAD(P)+] [Pontiella sulfatireligans]